MNWLWIVPPTIALANYVVLRVHMNRLTKDLGAQNREPRERIKTLHAKIGDLERQLAGGVSELT